MVNHSGGAAGRPERNGPGGASDRAAGPPAEDASAPIDGPVPPAVLQAIWESTTDVLAYADAGRTIRWISPSVTKLAGWSPEEMVGRRIPEFQHPADRSAATTLIASTTPGRPLAISARFLRKDGDYVWVESHARYVVDEDGHPTGFVSVWRDVSEVRAAQDRLAESEQRHRAMADHAGSGICLCSTDGTFLEVNPAMCSIMGRTADELLAGSWRDITHPDDIAADEAEVAKVLAGDIDSYQRRKRYVRPGGQVVWGDLTVSGMREANGSVRALVAEIVDVTE